MTLITVVGKADQIVEQPHVNARAAVGNASVADIKSMATLNVVVLHLGSDVKTPLAPGQLCPVEVIYHRCRSLPADIRDLHAGAKASLCHLVLAAKLGRRNCNLRTLNNPDPYTDWLVRQVTQQYGLAALQAEKLKNITCNLLPR